MANQSNCPSQWREYLAYGYRRFSEQLLTPDLALIISPGSNKIIVIGGETKNTLYEYDEHERIFYISFCNRGLGTRFNCPSCKQLYLISMENYGQEDSELISIAKETRFIECICGVSLVFNNRYEYLRLPFELAQLAPLYFIGMSCTADLFVRYTLNSDNSILIEEIGVVSSVPSAPSLTENYPFKFSNWSNPPEPSFVLQTQGGSNLAFDVKIWRTRTYTLGSEMFEENARRSSQYDWEKVYREVRSVPDRFANRKLLNYLNAQNENQQLQSIGVKNRPRGGDTRDEEIIRLWNDDEILRRYAGLVNELRPVWTTIKSMADPCDSLELQEEWLASIISDRPVIQNFLKQYPKLTKTLLRRAVDNKLPKVDRQPRQLAFYHAALELEVEISGDTLSIIDAYLKYEGKLPAPTTLQTPYDKGKSILNRSE